MGRPVPVSSRIFVSYSHEDREIVERIRQRLRVWGHTAVFVDRDTELGIAAGAEWTSTLYRSIANAHVVLAVCSASSRASRWCLAEAVIAQFNGIRIIPVVVDGSALDSHLALLQAVDCTSGDLDSLRYALESAGVRSGEDEIWDPDRPPFPGLRALEREDAALYFGREQELDRVLTDLEQQFQKRQRSVLVVQGGSGVGKSSFVRAGLLPRLARNHEQWLALPPLARYGNPVGDLIRAVDAAGGLSAPEFPHVDAELDEQRLANLLDQVLRAARRPPGARAVLVLDQAEALTSESVVGRAERFLKLLDALCADEDSPLFLIVVIRSDAFPRLAELLNLGPERAQIVGLGALDTAALVRVVEGPARVARYPSTVASQPGWPRTPGAAAACLCSRTRCGRCGGAARTVD